MDTGNGRVEGADSGQAGRVSLAQRPNRFGGREQTQGQERKED